MCEDSIEAEHLPENVKKSLTNQTIAPLRELLSIDEKLEKIEKNLIIEALRKGGGFQVSAAKLLGISPRKLAHRIGKYNIDPKIFKKS